MNFTGPYSYEEEKGGELRMCKKMCLLLIDCFSKMLWGDIFLSKRCERVATFLEQKINEEGVPAKVQSEWW